jgi:hypothetical protein
MFSSSLARLMSEVEVDIPIKAGDGKVGNVTISGIRDLGKAFPVG